MDHLVPWAGELQNSQSGRARQHDDSFDADGGQREREQRLVARRRTTRSRIRVVQQLLGRLPAGATAAQNTTVNLLAPSELYPLARRTEVDVRLAKILRFGRSRLDVGFDLYNLFNSNTTTSYQQTYLYSNNGATWLDPTAILAPRLARFNATLSF